MESCPRCGDKGHVRQDCSEKRFAKLYPGQYAFRGKIRTPDGGWVELEMSLGEHGPRLMAELTALCLTGEMPADLVKAAQASNGDER
jgi:hypothetical protein